MDVLKIKSDFPILDKDKIYLDNAATTQKPKVVIEAITKYYEKYNANPHRSAHSLGMAATDIYENGREVVAKFINASASEIVFTKSTTESLNLLSTVIARDILKEDDEVLISIESHHTNCVNWQSATKLKNAKLVYAYLKEDLTLDTDDLLSKINYKTKVISLTHASNVTGAITDIKSLIKKIREKSDAIIIVDGAQSVPHFKVDVKDLDCDFYAASGHKFLAPMGIGFLYGKYDKLNSLNPFLYGGDMIEYVYENESTFLDAPHKFEAGTQNVGGVYGLTKAISYLSEIGLSNIKKHEEDLINYAYDLFSGIKDLNLYTTPREKTAVLSFNINDAHPHDIATILDSLGIMIRSGHHCAQPLHRYLGRPFSARASFYIYNTKDDVDKLYQSIKKVREVLRLGS